MQRRTIESVSTTKYYFAGGKRVAFYRPGGPGASPYYYVHSDNLGNAHKITDSSGAVKNSYLYYPWGGARDKQELVDYDYEFNGQRLIASAGMYYYSDAKSHGRFYDPSLGRWTQADSMVPKPGDPQDWNRYSYVDNNPVRSVDPDGHWTEKQLKEHLGKDWEKVYFDPRTGVYGGRPAFEAMLRSDKTTDLTTLGLIATSLQAGRAVSAAPGMADIVRNSDALVLGTGASFGIAPEGAGVGGGAGFEFVTNLRSGEASMFATSSGQLEVGPDLGINGSISFGLVRDLPSNAAYSGVFWGVGGAAMAFGGITAGASFGTPTDFSGTGQTAVIKAAYTGGLRVGATVNANVSTSLEVQRTTAEGSRLFPAIRDAISLIQGR